MALEIERKFLLASNQWRAHIERSTPMRQGYLRQADAAQMAQGQASVRVRLAGERAWLNIKAATVGIARAEFEYPIPVDDARSLLADLCHGVVTKTRHEVHIDGVLFEIDEFADDNAGLIVAEVELPHVDAPFPHPTWLGREVSTLTRYYNVNLITHPWRQWSAAERAAEDAPC